MIDSTLSLPVRCLLPITVIEFRIRSPIDLLHCSQLRPYLVVSPSHSSPTGPFFSDELLRTTLNRLKLVCGLRALTTMSSSRPAWLPILEGQIKPKDQSTTSAWGLRDLGLRNSVRAFDFVT